MPASAPVASPVTSSPIIEPPTLPRPSSAMSAAITANRWLPCRSPWNRPISVNGPSAAASSRAGAVEPRWSSITRTGASTNPTAVTMPDVVSPSANSGPDDCGAFATRSATTVCNPIAGTTPITSTASSELISPNALGVSTRAAIRLRR